MRLEAVCHGRAEAEVRAYEDERRPRDLSPRGAERRVERVEVVAVGDADRLPSVGFEAFRATFGEGDLGRGRKRDRVVVVETDQLAELQVPGKGSDLCRHAFHQITVADDGPGMVIDDVVTLAVVLRREVRLGDGHADGSGETLTERAGGHFHAGCAAALRMPRRLAAPLAELLEVIEREVIAGDVQQAIEQRRAVPGREHEPIAVGPERVDRIVPQLLRPECVGHGRRAERQAGVAAVGLLHHVDRQETKRVDALLVEHVCHGHSSIPLSGRGARRQATRSRGPRWPARPSQVAEGDRHRRSSPRRFCKSLRCRRAGPRTSRSWRSP